MIMNDISRYSYNISFKKIKRAYIVRLEKLMQAQNYIYNMALRLHNKGFSKEQIIVYLNEKFKNITTKDGKTCYVCNKSVIQTAVNNYFTAYFNYIKGNNAGSLEGFRYEKPKPKDINDYSNFFYLNDFLLKDFGSLILNNTKKRIEFKFLDIKLYIPFKYNINNITKLRSIRLYYKEGYIKVMIEMYKNTEVNINKYKSKKVVAIDIGSSNLLTCFYNFKNPEIYTFSQCYFKKKENLRFGDLEYYKKYIITNILNKFISNIKKYGVNVIYIGNMMSAKYTKDKKDKSFFISIFHYYLYIKLDRIARKNGIIVKRIDESYTSRASFLDGDKMEHFSSFSGKRIKRDIYLTQNGYLINADINGAANILRKIDSRYKNDLTEKLILQKPKRFLFS